MLNGLKIFQFCRQGQQLHVCEYARLVFKGLLFLFTFFVFQG